MSDNAYLRHANEIRLRYEFLPLSIKPCREAFIFLCVLRDPSLEKEKCSSERLNMTLRRI